VQMLVKLGDPVTKGQKLAIQRNAFGDVLREYTATTGRPRRDHRDRCGARAGQRLLQVLTMAGPRSARVPDVRRTPPTTTSERNAREPAARFALEG